MCVYVRENIKGNGAKCQHFLNCTKKTQKFLVLFLQILSKFNVSKEKSHTNLRAM